MSRKIKRRYSNPLERARSGDASKIFKSAAAELRPGIKVFILCRESSESNRRKLADQLRNLSRPEVLRGAEVVGRYGFVASGYEREHEHRDVPSWSYEVMQSVAEALRAGATHLLMESVDRGVRSPLFHPSKCPKAGAREWDLEEFRELTRPLVLVTDLQPNSSQSKEAAYRSRRGQRMSGRAGGRPAMPIPAAGRKRAIRLREQPKAVQLRSRGFSHRAIAEKLGVPRTTVQRWVSEA